MKHETHKVLYLVASRQALTSVLRTILASTLHNQ